MFTGDSTPESYWKAAGRGAGPGAGEQGGPLAGSLSPGTAKMCQSEVGLVSCVGVVYPNSLQGFKNQLKSNQFKQQRLLYLYRFCFT